MIWRHDNASGVRVPDDALFFLETVALVVFVAGMNTGAFD
jgi:hypothetical protein